MSSIYLVDDHAIMRECLRILLEAGQHTVVGESADPTEALADLVRLGPDILLLDLHLEARSGLELLAELQRRQLPTRCIALTSSDQPGHVADTLRMGAAGYVLKKSASSDLLCAIDSVMLGKKYLGREVAELATQAFTKPATRNPLETLSPRELQIIRMVVNGSSSAEIGQTLHLSATTIATYRSRLMFKLGVSDIPGLVRLAAGNGLFDTQQG